MLALQAQLPSSVPWAINLRSRRFSGWVKLMRPLSLLGLYVRGQCAEHHVTSANDHHWLRQVLRHRYRAWMRSLEEEGLTRAWLKKLGRSHIRALPLAGPQSREEPARLGSRKDPDHTRLQREAALRAGGSGTFLDRRTFSQAYIEGFLVGVLGGVIPFATRGLARCRRDCPGRRRHHACVALAELARRYAWGAGPVSVEDFSRWTSSTKLEPLAALRCKR